MRHALWLLSFVSAIGLAQRAPELTPPPAPPASQSIQVTPTPQSKLYFLPAPIYFPSAPDLKSRVFLTGPMPYMAGVICAAPLVRAPLGNSEKMPISVPPVISKETDVTVPSPACDELSANGK